MKKNSRILIFTGLVTLTLGFLSFGFSRNAFAARPSSHEPKRPEPAFSRFLKTAFFGSKLPAQEKSRNKIFVLMLLGMGALSMVLKMLGADIPPPWGSLWAIFYTACAILYGFWILNLFSGLFLGWTFPSVVRGIFAGASTASVLTLLDHRARTRRTLTPGYRKCPHCGEAIVLLAVECFACHRKVE